jgi:N6-adenosine-specific RNA methylase IME4
MKYKTVVIDPPWDVGLTGGALLNTKYYRCGKPLPYKRMSDEEILNFPINDFADSQCSLFLWTTHSKLPVALKILEKWGFKYHVTLVWYKQTGIGINGFYRDTEFILFGYRGKFSIDVGEGNYIKTLIAEKATTHSRKPDRFYAMLVKRTQKPRIDIFARKRHFGFDAYGDQVESQIEIPLLEASNVSS